MSHGYKQKCETRRHADCTGPFGSGLAHGSGHTHLGVALSEWQSTFVTIVILISPLVAMILLWTRYQRAGLFLLAISMVGSFVFGVYYHFIAAGADNAFTLRQEPWTAVFRITAALLAVIEAAGCAWCIWALRLKTDTGLK